MSVVKKYRDQFRVSVFDKDFSRCEQLAGTLRVGGYQYTAFQDSETLFASLEKNLPHILIVFYRPLSVEFRTLLKKTRELTAETEVIVLGSGDFWPGIKNLFENKLVDDFWAWPLASPDSLTLRLDQFVEKTIYKYLSEEKDEKIQGIVKTVEASKDLDSVLIDKPKALGGSFEIPSTARTEAHLVDSLIEGLKAESPASEFAYLKYHRAKEKVLVYKTSFSAETYTRGQFFDYSDEIRRQDKKQGYKAIRTVLSELFLTEAQSLFPLEFDETTFGFIVGFNLPEASSGIVDKAARYSALALRNMELEKSQSDPLPVEQFSKAVDSRNFYEVLSKEVSRSRRIHSPVSVLFAHIQYRGEQESAIKGALEKVQDMVRVYDVVTQTSEQEIAIVLPHCDATSGAMKAERLRRALMAESLETQNPAVRLCFGVSEFPGLCQGSDELLESAKLACDQVLASGKNKVCLFTQSETFEPEFQVEPLERPGFDQDMSYRGAPRGLDE